MVRRAPKSMEIGRTGKTLGGFGLSGWAVLPILVELAGKVVLGRENTGQMELPGGSRLRGTKTLAGQAHLRAFIRLISLDWRLEGALYTP